MGRFWRAPAVFCRWLKFRHAQRLSYEEGGWDVNDLITHCQTSRHAYLYRMFGEHEL